MTTSISLKKSRVWVKPVVERDIKGEKTKTVVIGLSNVAETRRAIGVHVELVGGRHVFVNRQISDRLTVYASGFGKYLGKDGIKRELQEIFNGHTTIIGIFLPNDQFGYILVEGCDKVFRNALEKSFRRGKIVITIRVMFMLPQILDAFRP